MKTHLKGGLGQLKEGGVHKPFLILGGAFKRGRGFIGGFTIYMVNLYIYIYKFAFFASIKAL